MHVRNSFNINISDDPVNPKIVYLGDVLDESKREKGIELVKKYTKVFAYIYKEMLSMHSNVVVHNIITWPYAKPIK